MKHSVLLEIVEVEGVEDGSIDLLCDVILGVWVHVVVETHVGQATQLLLFRVLEGDSEFALVEADGLHLQEGGDEAVGGWVLPLAGRRKGLLVLELALGEKGEHHVVVGQVQEGILVGHEGHLGVLGQGLALLVLSLGGEHERLVLAHWFLRVHEEVVEAQGLLERLQGVLVAGEFELLEQSQDLLLAEVLGVRA